MGSHRSLSANTEIYVRERASSVDICIWTCAHTVQLRRKAPENAIILTQHSRLLPGKLGPLHCNILVTAWYAISSSWGLVWGGTLACYWKLALMNLQWQTLYNLKTFAWQRPLQLSKAAVFARHSVKGKGLYKKQWMQYYAHWLRIKPQVKFTCLQTRRQGGLLVVVFAMHAGQAHFLEPVAFGSSLQLQF